MTDMQFQRLLDAITDIVVDMPTWLSLVIGALLSIAGSIIFDVYKNYKTTKEVKAQIKSVENRLNGYLDFLIPDNVNAYKKNELVLDVNQKIEDTLIQLIDLSNSINLNVDQLNDVLINTIYIKQYVELSRLKGSNALPSDLLASTKEKAIEIKSAVNVERG